MARLSSSIAVTSESGEVLEGEPLLARCEGCIFKGVQNLAGWWMSEKLDGVRAYWTGKEFLSRLGNPLHAPDWFCQGLPGEI